MTSKTRNNFPVKTKIVLKELRHITFNTMVANLRLKTIF